jgi:hypothetical protein
MVGGEEEEGKRTSEHEEAIGIAAAHRLDEGGHVTGACDAFPGYFLRLSSWQSVPLVSPPVQ